MNILVVGAGMYVTGRDGTGTGTILSSLAECSRSLALDKVMVIGTNPGNAASVTESTDRINQTIGTSLTVEYRAMSAEPRQNIAQICSESNFDCAIISVPDHLHYNYAKALMEHGVPILVVKPLTPKLDEAIDLVSVQGRTGVYAAVEFHKRWDATNLWVQKALSASSLGKILYFSVEYSQKISIPATTFRGWSDKTNIFQYLGVHYVDLIYFLTGYIPQRVMATGTAGILKEQGIDTWDSVHATIVWQKRSDASDTFFSYFATNWIDPICTSAMSDQQYKVIGTKGRIECDQKNRGLELVQENMGIQQINPYFSEYLPGDDGCLRFVGYGHDSICRFVRDISELAKGSITIADLELLRPTIRQSLVSTAVIDAVNKSLNNNFSWKEIDEFL